MRDYEVVYIFESALEEQHIDEKLDRFHGLISGDGGELTAVDHWGKRLLAYPIRDREAGYYVVAHFTTDPRALIEFERVLKLDDEVLRHLVVVNEGHLSSEPFPEEDPEEGEGDDDDGDDDEEN